MTFLFYIFFTFEENEISSLISSEKKTKMKKYSRLSSAAVVMGALRINVIIMVR